MSKILIKKILKGLQHLASLLKSLRDDREIGFSFNLTDRCPANCKCYWKAQSRVCEMGINDPDGVVRFFKARRAEGKLIATIIGGEPYVNPQLLKRVVEIMPANWVVTSATTPLMHLPKTTHFVSIDGDAQMHDTIRGMPGLYDRVVKNLDKVRREGDFPVFIHCVLNHLNFMYIQDMVETWRNNGLADGIVFSTMTPILEANDEYLRLKREDRLRIVDELLWQREQYPNFVLMTEKMIKSFHPDRTIKQNPKTCGTAQLVASYGADGNRIQQCILSEKANCTECGCIITAIFESVWKRPIDWPAIRILGKMWTP